MKKLNLQGISYIREICLRGISAIMEIKITGVPIAKKEQKLRAEKISKFHKQLIEKGNVHIGSDLKGWVNLPGEISDDSIKKIYDVSDFIRKKCSLFIVIGIGGSFLGSKMVIEALNGSIENYPEVVYAGYNMNGAYLKKLKKRIEKESVCVCVISKSGRTVEPLLSYAVIKDWMFAKYGYKEARQRIFVITDEKKGDLRPEVVENRFESFVIPDNIGGRYSVLTPAGLLPIAVAGHNIKKLISGANDMQNSDWSPQSDLIKYSVNRTLLQENGKVIEIFEYFEGNLIFLGEWLRQLFGETEGKEGKGAYPTCLFFSRDLHSMGQFLQQGRQIFFETMLRVKKSPGDVVIPWYAGYPYAGKTIEQINDCVEKGLILAHKKAGIPITEIFVEELSEFTLGQMIYFFEMSAALSAYAMDLNPFNQPGVENYKNEMQRLIERL